MFDLEQEIKWWREDLAGREALLPEHIDELEDHLRSNIAGLNTGDVTTEEAFLLSSRRLGTNEALNREFAKTNRANVWVGRVMWMLIGFILLKVIGSLSGIAAPLVEMGVASMAGPGIFSAVAYWFGYLLGWGILLLALCRQATNGGTLWTGCLSRIGRWSNDRPVRAIALLIGGLVGIGFLSQMLNASAFRLHNPEYLAYSRAIGAVLFQFLQLLVIAGAALCLYRRQQRPELRTAD